MATIMGLGELLVQQSKKDIAIIRKALSLKKPSAMEKEARIALHTLKGDLSSLPDNKALETVANLKDECEKVFGGLASAACALGLLGQLELEVEKMGVSGAGEWKRDLRERFENTVNRISENLGKEIRLKCDFKLAAPDKGLLVFIAKVITPLVVNSCVHGIGKKGRVGIDIAEENGEVLLIVSDDGALDGSRPLGREEKLYAGDGLGVESVRLALKAVGGRLEARQGKRRETRLSFKRSLET